MRLSPDTVIRIENVLYKVIHQDPQSGKVDVRKRINGTYWGPEETKLPSDIEGARIVKDPPPRKA